MSYHLKFIIPLINKNITLDDINEKAGFIGAYTYYFKTPTLRNQIFLMYNNTTNNTTNKLKTLSNLREIKRIDKNGTSYMLYILNITDDAIMRITDGIFALSSENKNRIMKFWKLTDDDINEYITNNTSIRNYKYEEQYLYA